MHLNQHLQTMFFHRVIKQWYKFTKMHPNLALHFADFKPSHKEVKFIVLCNCCSCQVVYHRNTRVKVYPTFQISSARRGKPKSPTLSPLYYLCFNHISTYSAALQTILGFNIFQIQSIEKMREQKHESWPLGSENNLLSLDRSCFQARQLKMGGTHNCCS